LNEITGLRNEILQLKAHNEKVENDYHSLSLQLKFGNDKENSFKTQLNELKASLEEKDVSLVKRPL